MSVFDRLDRTLPGDRLRTRSLAGAVERKARTVEPRPNAPLLIRVVQHPYALHPGSPARRAVYRIKVEALESVDRRAVLRAALAERRDKRSTSLPERTRAFVIRPSRWLLLPDTDP